jgi:hypothetical protein
LPFAHEREPLFRGRLGEVGGFCGRVVFGGCGRGLGLTFCIGVRDLGGVLSGRAGHFGLGRSDLARLGGSLGGFVLGGRLLGSLAGAEEQDEESHEEGGSDLSHSFFLWCQIWMSESGLRQREDYSIMERCGARFLSMGKTSGF